MTQTYFGGPKATTNRVRKLNATDFQSFVANYLNAPVPLRLTRAEYHALPDDAQRAAKDGPYVCGCSFSSDIACGGTVDGVAAEETTRNDANATAINLVCLDLDTLDDGSTPDYLRDIADSPDLAVDQLHPFNAVIYETASSTPTTPRLRIMVDAASLPPNKPTLRAAVHTVARMLGLPDSFQGVCESTVISQPMFRPVQFRGDDRSPVLATRTTGRPMTLDDLDDAPQDAPKRYAWDGTDDPSCGLDQLPLQGITPEDIREPLFAIDPDIGYEQWTHIAAALRHQFRGEEQASEAYALFDEWSATGTKYRGEKETYLKWRSFKPDTMGKQAVTIRSLMHYAQQAGWKPAKVATLTRDALKAWIEECDCAETLQAEGPQRIAALPFRSTTSDDSMIDVLRRRILGLGVHGVRAASLKADMKRERKAKAREEAQEEIPNWLRPFCFCAPSGKFIHVNKGEDFGIGKDSFDLAFGRHIEENEDGAKPTASYYAMHSVRLKVIDGTTYDPRHADERFFQFHGKDYLNEYNPASVPELDHAKKERVGELFYNHLLVLLGCKEYADIVLHYIAHIVQRPGVKIRWMPLIQSAEGAGKSLLFYLIAAAIGESNCKIANPAAIQSGSWNDWAVGCQFLVIEELLIKGKDRQSVANTYKDFLTNQTINLVAKFKNSRVVQNTANAIAFTNSHNPVHLDESNRRYALFKSPLQTKDHILQLTESGHFLPLDKIRRKYGGALRAYLLDVVIPDDFPTDGPAPWTRYTQQLINESRNAAMEAIADVIESGSDPLVAPDLVHFDRLESLVNDKLRNNYDADHWLYQLGYEPALQGKRAMVNGVRTTVWYHRERFDAGLDDPVEEMVRRAESDAGL